MGSSSSKVQFVSFSNFNNVLCNFDFVGGNKMVSTQWMRLIRWIYIHHTIRGGLELEITVESGGIGPAPLSSPFMRWFTCPECNVLV